MSNRSPIALTLLMLVLAGCRSETPDTTADEWRAVMAAKKKAMHADLAARQEYADRLLKFLHRHPDHARARQVYDDLQLAFARELSARGDHAVALRYYEDLTARRPADAELAAERAAVVDLQTLQRDELEAVHSGMSREEVERVLGRPRPGWKRNGAEPKYESWFYPAEGGGVAAVHFSDGKVFAVDHSNASETARNRALQAIVR